MYLFLAAIFVLSSSGAVLAQDKHWRPIDSADLAATKPVVESEADVEAIFWEMRIDDASMFNLDIWHYVRVKIFSERGRDQYSSFGIPHSRRTKIKNLATRVVRPDGSSDEVKPDEIFDREIFRAGMARTFAKTFVIPNIEVGSIVEYRYQESTAYKSAFGMRLPLQRDIPVRQMTYWYKPQTKEPQVEVHNAPEFKFVKDKNKYFQAQVLNVPAFREEPWMPPEVQVRPWFRLASRRSRSFFMIGDVIIGSARSSKYKDAKEYWDSVASSYVRRLEWIRRKDRKITDAAIRITAGASTQDEKLRLIYDYLQTNVRNISYASDGETGEPSRSLIIKHISDLLEEKRPLTSAQINLLFAALANAAGIEIHLALNSSRNDVVFTPTIANANYVTGPFVAVYEKGEPLVLNPGNPFLPYGVLPWDQENAVALVVGQGKYVWTINPALKYHENHITRTARLKLDENGNIEGDIVIELKGQPALVFRQAYWDETTDVQERSIVNEVKARIGHAEVMSTSIENLTESTKPLIKRYKVKVQNYAQRTGSRMFFQPGFFQYGIPQAFLDSPRKYDVFFRYPWSENDQIELKLPDGFELEIADPPSQTSHSKKVGGHTIKIRHSRAENLLYFDREFYFGNAESSTYSSESYDAIRILFQMFHKADNQMLLLKQNPANAVKDV